MKSASGILMLLLLAAPAWAGQKITVQQLEDLLVSLRRAGKTDAEVAAQLTQVELTEELTRHNMDAVAENVPGPLSSVQMYVLEAHSAALPPPPSDLPGRPAPDTAAEKAILDKAIAYAAGTYAQLPHLVATRTTLRFEEQWPKLQGGGVQMASTKGTFDLDNQQLGRVIRYTSATEVHVDLRNGVETDPAPTDKTHWGENGQIAILSPPPALSHIVAEAQATGQIKWLRWETVNGVVAAVYTFSVGKKATHYSVDYCCFRQEKTDGLQLMHTTMPSSRLDISNWDHHKPTVPYHGEIFIDPDTGIILRLVNQAEFKPTDVLRQEEQRIDYTRVQVGANSFILPARAVLSSVTINAITLAQPVGGRIGNTEIFTKSCNTILVAEYKDYQQSEAAAPK